MKTRTGIWKTWPILWVTFIIGITACAQVPNVPPPKVYPIGEFIVPSGYTKIGGLPPEEIKVEANEGETIRVVFSVKGALGDDIYFSMRDPAGNTIYDKRDVKKFAQSFLASDNGTYLLLFENNQSPFRRTVNLTIFVFPKPQPEP